MNGEGLAKGEEWKEINGGVDSKARRRHYEKKTKEFRRCFYSVPSGQRSSIWLETSNLARTQARSDWKIKEAWKLVCPRRVRVGSREQLSVP